jgi:hypothetical protein
VITSASARKRPANCQSSFGPTCRLVSSLEVGPGATIGALKQGYPLLQHEDVVPTRLSLVEWRAAPDPTTWTAPGPPRIQRRQYPPGVNSGFGPPWESAGPLRMRTGPPGKVQDLYGREPDLWDRSQTPQCGVRATHSRVPRFRDKEYPGLNQGQAGFGADTCPDHAVYASAPRSSGDPMLPRGLLPVT